MHKMISPLLAALTIIPLLSSCGKSKTGEDVQREEYPDSADESTIDGLYRATFITLNPHINGTIPGSLTFLRKEDRLITFVRLFAGGPRAWHQQGVYLGKRCPTLNDDTNGDGIIDVVEAMQVVGKMIIPLDANMNSQMSGRNLYPLADLSGYYHYERVSSFRRLFDDLREPDLDVDDHIAKLSPDEKFSFENRVVMVQGVVEETVLPESVATLGRRMPFQTLPITCGIIKKVTDSPGTSNTDVIPGPVADVVDGQDRPAPAEDTTGETGGTVAGTTGSNENETGEVGDPSGSAGGRSTTGGSTTGGSTTGGSTTGGSTTGASTTGGSTTGGSTTGGSATGGSTTGGSTTGGTTTGGTTTGGTTTGGTTTGGTTTGGTTTGGTTTGSSSGGIIGGFVGGRSGI